MTVLEAMMIILVDFFKAPPSNKYNNFFINSNIQPQIFLTIEAKLDCFVSICSIT